MTPTHLWPIGSAYATVQTVTMKNSGGFIDPEIREWLVLDSEAPAFIRQAQAQNPYLTAFVCHRGVWNGPRNG